MNEGAEFRIPAETEDFLNFADYLAFPENPECLDVARTRYDQMPRNSRAVPESSCAFCLEESFIDSMSSPGFASPNGKG